MKFIKNLKKVFLALVVLSARCRICSKWADGEQLDDSTSKENENHGNRTPRIYR